MTDINKQIEEALRSKIKNFKNSTTIFDTRDYVLIDDAIGIVSSFIDSSRWRKVSEEMPEVKDENYFINIKRYDDEFKIDAICVFAEMEDVKGYLEFNNVDSWKPID